MSIELSKVRNVSPSDDSRRHRLCARTIGLFNIDAPAANCLQRDRCRFTATIEGIRVRISTIDVSDVGQYSLGNVIEIPAGYTGFTVVVAAD